MEAGRSACSRSEAQCQATANCLRVDHEVTSCANGCRSSDAGDYGSAAGIAAAAEIIPLVTTAVN